MRKNDNGVEEDIPEHIKRIQEKALGQSSEKAEIDWGFWFYVSKHLFHFSDAEFFNTTLRRLYTLTDQHEKFNKQQQKG